MRIRFPLLFVVALTLALPAFGSPAASRHHRHLHHRQVYHADAHPVHAHRRHRRPAQPEVATDDTARHTSIPSVQPVHFVPPMRGTYASLVRQNRRNEAEGLVRIENNAQLIRLQAQHELVALPASAALRINPGMPANRRYCRPWTARFLTDLARSHYARFHGPLQVNSAVRTVEFQRALLLINGNAAPAEGDVASPHLTGAAVDIGKRGLSFSEIAWLRSWLLPLQTAGKIDVEEEFYQACFHITVYHSYLPKTKIKAPPRDIARHRRGTETLLAAGVR